MEFALNAQFICNAFSVRVYARVWTDRISRKPLFTHKITPNACCWEVASSSWPDYCGREDDEGRCGRLRGGGVGGRGAGAAALY